MQRHWPSDSFTHVSVKRSCTLTALPALSVPLPVKIPVAIAVSPCTTTCISVYSALLHLTDFASATTASLPVMSLPSVEVSTMLSASSGASNLMSLVCCDLSQVCSSPTTSLNVPASLPACAVATLAKIIAPNRPQIRLFFFMCVPST